MPIYEYACDSCDHNFEVQQGMRDEPLHTCPRCNGTVRRVFGLSSVIFKGSGFYCNDSKRADSPKEGACATCPANAGATS